MKKSDVTALYPMEELIPLVGMLAEAFTAKESSSVTFERAKAAHGVCHLLYCAF